MKRALFKVMLFLLLGAIVNIAVAWGAVLIPWNGERQASSLDLDTEVAWWREQGGAVPLDMATGGWPRVVLDSLLQFEARGRRIISAASLRGRLAN